MTGQDTDPVQHSNGMERVTSPMQEFSMSQVTTGLVVTVIGLAVVFGVPLLL
ncbi:DUF7550 family protein [Haladaptatus caseinilyticus]|uniref:DUF7550 family protein n=1 Tax=Haladaptatus caseinilyticus TaxID=2993314 RepID=UPI00224B584E|nr:hypothetical protein [Haladaptatus caseinilyticus]